MRNVLIVDDEAAFRLSLADGLSVYADKFSVLHAENGQRAVNVLQQKAVDLVVTDLKMPEMDGFELLAWLSQHKPNVPVIVMTAYGTPEIEQRLIPFGVSHCVDKPVEFRDLAGKILEELEAGSQGHVQGFPLPTFLQLLGMERKSCTLQIVSGPNSGALYLQKGELVSAQTSGLTGVEAAYEIISWDNPAIHMERSNRLQPRTIDEPLNGILMEAFRLKDERERDAARSRPGPAAPAPEDEFSDLDEPQSAAVQPQQPSQTEKEKAMSLEKHLVALKEIKGYKASGIMNFTGETLVADSQDANIDLALVGATFNDIFRGAHEASKKIGLEAAKETVISTPKGIVVMRCSGTDAKVHFHLIAVLAADGNQALMKMQVEKMVPAVMNDLA